VIDRQKGTLKRAKVCGSIAVVALAIVTVPTSALAGEDSEFSLRLGMFITNWDTKTRVNASGGDRGVSVDFENDLGFDKSDSVFRIDGHYRFNKKHRIDFGAFDFSRSASKVIEKEIEWDGNVFPVSASVAAESDFKVYKLAYTYSILNADKGFLGLTGGFYVADIEARLSAENIASRSGGGITAPLPVIGLRGEYELADKWTFRASSEFFFFEYEEYDGSLVDLYAGIDYQLFERAAIGLGLNSVKLDVGISDASLNGDVDWGYDGGLLFIKVDF